MKNEPNLKPMSKNIWIIIPAYEEEEMIGSVVEEVRKENYNQILVIDDGSNDNTAKVAEAKGAEVIKHAKNSGLGASLRTGLREAKSRNADVAVTLDADGQHDPKDIDRLIKKLNGADVVIGVRRRSQMPLNKRFGNTALDILTHFLGGPLTDSQSGFRAFGPKALERIRIWSDHYSVSSEIIVQVGEENLSFRTIPIKGIFTDYSRASSTTIASGIKIFFDLLRTKVLHKK